MQEIYKYNHFECTVSTAVATLYGHEADARTVIESVLAVVSRRFASFSLEALALPCGKGRDKDGALKCMDADDNAEYLTRR